MNAYLEFNEPDDYIAHLRAQTGAEQPSTHLEITSITGARGEHGLRGVTYYATLTQCFDPSAGSGQAYIAVCAIPILNTTNFHLQVEKGEMRDKLHANFDKVRARLESKGVVVERGRWSVEVPAYLREG